MFKGHRQRRHGNINLLSSNLPSHLKCTWQGAIDSSRLYNNGRIRKAKQRMRKAEHNVPTIKYIRSSY